MVLGIRKSRQKPEVIKKIRLRTKEAMSRPNVKMKLGHSWSKKSKQKLKEAIRSQVLKMTKEERFQRFGNWKGKKQSLESRIKRSKSITDLINKGIFQPISSRNFVRKDLNQFFRSSWEANYARILNFEEIPWEYEKHSFFVRKLNKYYTPDFYLSKFNLFVEIKGYFCFSDKVLIKEFCKQYKKKITIIDEKSYIKLVKKYKNKISNWEN